MARLRQDVFTIQEGSALFECPDEISRQSAGEVLEWLELVIRRIRREADAEVTPPKARQIIEDMNEERWGGLKPSSPVT